jgi:hypothetical protein
LFDYRIAAYNELIRNNSELESGSTKKKKNNAEDDDDSPELKEEIRLVKADPDLTGDEKSRAELKIRKRYRAELLLNDEDEGGRWEMNDEERRRGGGGEQADEE